MKLRRRFFHFRLSTAITGMLVAAAMLYMNVRIHWSWNEFSSFGQMSTSWNGERGWPYYFYNANYTVDDYEGLGEGRMQSKYGKTNPPFKLDRVTPYETWEKYSMLLDIGFSVAIVVTSTVACEYLIRRREAPKP